MKKSIFLACSLLLAVCAQNRLEAQNSTQKTISIGVFVSEQSEIVPQIAQAAFEDKLRQIVTVNGMGVNDQAQFFITGIINVTDKEIIGGAPTKVAQKADVTLYIVDAATDKIFETMTIATRGVGTNDNKAYISALKSIQPTSAPLKGFVANASGKIISYYEGQIDNIINKAESLSKLGQHGAALYELSTVPEVCKGYDKVVAKAQEVYQKMIDSESLAALQKAKMIWKTGHNYESASKAGEYLATVSPYSSCYADAEALADEISGFVQSERAYDKQQDQAQLDWERKMEMERNKRESESIAAWRAIGEAYGKNQQPQTYHVNWLYK